METANQKLDTLIKLTRQSLKKVEGERILMNEINRLRSIIVRERAAVARFMVPHRARLSENWLALFVEEGILRFDSCGFVYPAELPPSFHPTQPAASNLGDTGATESALPGAASDTSGPAAGTNTAPDPASTSGSNTDPGASQ